MPVHDGRDHPFYSRFPPVGPGGPHPDRNATDALLTAAGQGDLGAFAEFYDHTAASVFGLLRIWSKDPVGRTSATERATEDVYLSVWRAAPSFRPAVRSAYSTLMLVARRELAAQISELVPAARSSRDPSDGAA